MVLFWGVIAALPALINARLHGCAESSCPGQAESREVTKEGGGRREQEEGEHGMTQATAIKVAHGGADGGRSHGGGVAADSRGLTNGGGAGGGGARGRDGQPKSKGDGEDPGDQSRADGNPDGRGGVGATED